MSLDDTATDLLVAEYRQCAEICASTDYGDKSTVEKHNKSVDRMYSIVEEITLRGKVCIDHFAILLDEDNTRQWLAFQLLDRSNVSKEIEKKCLSIIKLQAQGKGSEALGAKVWLKDYNANKRKTIIKSLLSFLKR